MAWTAGAKWSAQIVTWCSTVMLARLLAPADFGLVGMTSVYLGCAMIVSEGGFGSAIIRTKDLSPVQVRQLNTVSAAIGLAACLLSAAIAPIVSGFFAAPQMLPVLAVMSLTFLPAGLRTVPAALLQKNLQFDRTSMIEAVHALSQACLTVGLAFADMGVWALVLGNLGGSVTACLMNIAYQPVGFGRPEWSRVSRVIETGSHLLFTRLSWYAYSNADFFIAGKMLGKASVGAYGFAWAIGSAPVDKIASTVTRVTPAILAAVQSDKAALRRYLSLVTEALSVVTFPAAIGLALIAPVLVPTVLGPKWNEAIVPLQLLACFASLRSISTVPSQVLTVVGMTRYGMLNSLFSLAIMAPAFWFGSRWGIEGIAAGWVIGYPIVVIPLYYRVFRAIDMSFWQWARAILPATLGCVIMAVAMFSVDQALTAHIKDVWRLMVMGTTGVISYGGVLALVFPARLRQYRQSIRLFRQSG